MGKVKVKIKKMSDHAKIPEYANPGDACVDLYVDSIHYPSTNDFIEYGTGVSVEIPEGYVGLVFPRSSISKYDAIQANSVGVIDSGYRGEIKVRHKVVEGNRAYSAKFGVKKYQLLDRVAQLMIIPLPKMDFEVVDELSDTVRGDGGFGSSDKK